MFDGQTSINSDWLAHTRDISFYQVNQVLRLTDTQLTQKLRYTTECPFGGHLLRASFISHL